jgi:hypothetical protein
MHQASASRIVPAAGVLSVFSSCMWRENRADAGAALHFLQGPHGPLRLTVRLLVSAEFLNTPGRPQAQTRMCRPNCAQQHPMVVMEPVASALVLQYAPSAQVLQSLEGLHCRRSRLYLDMHTCIAKQRFKF